MIKKLTIATFVAAMSTAAVPLAHAQDATQPPSAPNPSEMKGGDAGGGDMAKGDSMKKGGSMKKSSKHSMKKKHKM